MNSEAVTFLHGALWISCWAVAVFFLRFWRASRDRLFAFFAVAFALLGFQWLSIGLLTWEAESRHEPFVLRLLAFLVILLGVIDKNRRVSQDKLADSSRWRSKDT